MINWWYDNLNIWSSVCLCLWLHIHYTQRIQSRNRLKWFSHSIISGFSGEEKNIQWAAPGKSWGQRSDWESWHNSKEDSKCVRYVKKWQYIGLTVGRYEIILIGKIAKMHQSRQRQQCIRMTCKTILDKGHRGHCRAEGLSVNCHPLRVCPNTLQWAGNTPPVIQHSDSLATVAGLIFDQLINHL